MNETEYARAFAHTYLADAFHSMGMLDKAMDEYHAAMDLMGKKEYDKLFLTLYNLAGVIYIGQDDEQVEDIQNRFERLSHYFDILDILMALKEYEDAARFTEKTERLLVGMECAGKWTRLMEYEIQIYTELGKEEPLERAYELFFQYDMKFKEISKQSAVKRLKKRIELQKEADRRTSMEEWQNVLFKRNEYDELTGVLNRRGIRKYMNKAFAAAREQKQKFAVLFVDVDFFKEFNDTYGHVAGDECLKKIAHILKHAVADKGMAGRYGGDEFLLTITGIQTISIMEVAMEIKKSLTKVAIPNKNSAVSDEVTVTIGGVNSVPEEKMDFPCYIEAADRMLYSLKKSSKNGFAINESVQGDEK